MVVLEKSDLSIEGMSDADVGATVVFAVFHGALWLWTLWTCYFILKYQATPHLRVRIPWLMVNQHVSLNAAVFTFELTRFFPDHTNCGVSFLLTVLFAFTFGVTLVMRSYVLSFALQVSNAALDYGQKGKSQTDEDMKSLYHARQRLRAPFVVKILIPVICISIIPVLIAVTRTEMGQVFSSSELCKMPVIEKLLTLIIAFMICISVFHAWYGNRLIDEDLNNLLEWDRIMFFFVSLIVVFDLFEYRMNHISIQTTLGLRSVAIPIVCALIVWCSGVGIFSKFKNLVTEDTDSSTTEGTEQTLNVRHEFEAIITTPDGFKRMQRLLTMVFAVENLNFWYAVQEFKANKEASPNERAREFLTIVKNYCLSDSPMELNISSRVKISFKQSLKGRIEKTSDIDLGDPRLIADFEDVKLDVFEEVVEQIMMCLQDNYTLLRRDFLKLQASDHNNKKLDSTGSEEIATEAVRVTVSAKISPSPRSPATPKSPSSGR